ncbi:MAG: hypothetical protein KKD28_09535 [Chloroflexi bacterium]|nr:hypothetical protein [Chloroflexota bacterium]MBU1661700.1 hypothetical protein [Chloroflexota bacterium]
MPSCEYDLGYLQASICELETYLLSKELYWPLSAASPLGEPAYSRLTLGGLLLSLERSRSRCLTPSQSAQLAHIETQLERTLSRWRAAWGRKAQWEFRSRLRQWENYLNELQRDPEAHAAFFRHEARLREMIDLLKPYMDAPTQADLELLNELDMLLPTLQIPDGI